jgi:hypothetical protein
MSETRYFDGNTWDERPYRPAILFAVRRQRIIHRDPRELYAAPSQIKYEPRDDYSSFPCGDSIMPALFLFALILAWSLAATAACCLIEKLAR